jgi:NAD(P)-dependent dehydrogenase (short-subunit alcohol dehydrogenase family)
VFALEDRTAIVTGGAAGLGRSLAGALARAGAVVTICDTRQKTSQSGESGRLALEPDLHPLALITTNQDCHRCWGESLGAASQSVGSVRCDGQAETPVTHS